MIIGGNHKEWPEEYDWFMPAWREGESRMDKEYEDWLWEQVLEDGPPQSDDMTWAKKHAYTEGIRYARDFIRGDRELPSLGTVRVEEAKRIGQL